jgi:hypothetical protein
MALAERGGETDQNVSLSEHETVFEIKILSQSHKAAGSMAGRPLVNPASQARALSVGKSVCAPEPALAACRVRRFDSLENDGRAQQNKRA